MTARAIMLAERPAAAAGPTIAFRSQTATTYAARTNTVVTAPAGLADGDILIALINTVTGGAASPAVTPPAGFAQIGSTLTVTSIEGDGGKLALFWKRAASESGSYTFTHGNCNSQAYLQAWSGALASGSPIGASSSNSGSGATTTGTGITTTAANSVLLFQSADWDGHAALSPPTGMTQLINTIVLYSAWQLIAAAGATGARTHTNSNATAEPWYVFMVELLNA